LIAWIYELILRASPSEAALHRFNIVTGEVDCMDRGVDFKSISTTIIENWPDPHYVESPNISCEKPSDVIAL